MSSTSRPNKKPRSKAISMTDPAILNIRNRPPKSKKLGNLARKELTQIQRSLPAQALVPQYKSPEARYAHMLINPHEVENELAPSRSDNEVTTIKLTRTFPISSSSPSMANGGFAFMTPDLHNPGQITGTPAFILPPLGTAKVSTSTQFSFASSSVEALLSGSTNPIAQPVAQVTVGNASGNVSNSTWEPVVDGGAVSHHAMRQICYPGVSTLGVPNVLHYSVTYASGSGSWNCLILGLDALAGWGQIGSVTVSSSAKTVSGTFTVGPNPINAISVINNAAGGPFSGTLTTSFDNSTYTTSAAGGVTFPAFEDESIADDVDKARVVAMSCLWKNTSAEIYNNGAMYAALMPRAQFTLDPGAFTDAISKLPTNRAHIGAAKEGAYVWWQPKDFDEFEVNDVAIKVSEYATSDLIFMGWTWGGPGVTASAMVTCTWVVEFHSPQQIFKKTTLPPITPQFDDMFQILARFPHAMCNPEHENAFQSFLRTAKRTGNAAYQHYQEHQVLYNTLFKFLADLAPMVL